MAKKETKEEKEKREENTVLVYRVPGEHKVGAAAPGRGHLTFDAKGVDKTSKEELAKAAKEGWSASLPEAIDAYDEEQAALKAAKEGGAAPKAPKQPRKEL